MPCGVTHLVVTKTTAPCPGRYGYDQSRKLGRKTADSRSTTPAVQHPLAPFRIDPTEDLSTDAKLPCVLGIGILG